MYIEQLKITRFRCFESAEMRFQYPGRRHGSKKSPKLPNVNLLLGDNGTGKSAVLKGIALAVLAPILPSAGFRPFLLVRRDANQMDSDTGSRDTMALVEAQIGMHEQDASPSESPWRSTAPLGHVLGQAAIWRRKTTEFIEAHETYSGEVMDARFIPKRAWEGIYDDATPAFFLAGYGAMRRVESVETFDPAARERSRGVRYQRVASLFEDYVTLVPVTLWIKELSRRSRLTQAVELLNRILPNDVRIDIDKAMASANGSGPSSTEDDIFFVNGTSLPFAGLSDGFRAFISWFGDLLYQMNRVTPEQYLLTDLRGVVIVDELDLLLHPAWQRTVVESLATTFPKIQFFFSTHSPVVTATLESDNVLVAERDPESGLSTVVPGHERVYGLSADQVLASAYFSLPTARAPGAEREMRSLARRAWAGDSSASIQLLSQLAKGFEEEDKGLGVENDSERERS